MTYSTQTLKNYRSFFILFLSIILGGFTGYYYGSKCMVLKPLGDLFLNLIFTAVVPLVFFSIASALAQPNELKKLGRILFFTLITFFVTGLIAAFYMIGVLSIFPLHTTLTRTFSSLPALQTYSLSEQFVTILSVPEFSHLLSHQNLLSLIVFSFFVGLSTATLGKKAEPFRELLHAGKEVFMKIMSFIMYLAPIGFFAYFAVLVSQIGPKIAGDYAQITIIYYGAALVYFIIAFSVYAYFSGGKSALNIFWKNVSPSALTALATCSSSASIPINLTVTEQMRVPNDIRNVVIPLGAMLHKDGSVLGGILKIVFLFSVFQMNFHTPSALVMLALAGVLVGSIMGAIPSGGLIAETFILSLFGFPPETLMMIGVISIIIDPLATLLNVTGDITAAQVVQRFMKE